LKKGNGTTLLGAVALESHHVIDKQNRYLVHVDAVAEVVHGIAQIG
jgi:hypothetical protein